MSFNKIWDIPTYRDRRESGLFVIKLDGDTFPNPSDHPKKDPLTLYWKKEAFDSCLVVLGWKFENKVTSVGLVRADRAVTSFVLDDAFSKFRIKEEQLGGYPFFCIFDQDSLNLIPTEKNFTKESSDYLYRLACTGSEADFLALGISGKKLSKVRLDNELSLMHGAALYGNLSVLNYLKDVGAHKIKSRGSNTVMRYAIFGGRLSSVRFLSGLGLSALEKSRTEFTPFIDAVHSGHTDIVDFLTNDTKYLKFRDSGGNAAFRSVLFRRPQVFEIIKKKSGGGIPKIEQGNEYLAGMNLQETLHDNCLLGSVELVSVLLESDLSERLDIDGLVNGFTPIRAATKSGNPDLVRYLIGLGANLKTTYGRYESTLLHDAANEGLPEITKVLVEAGLDINSRDLLGMTPLYTAVLGDVPNLVKTQGGEIMC